MLNCGENCTGVFLTLKMYYYEMIFLIRPAHKYLGKMKIIEVEFIGKKSKTIDFQSDVHVVQ